MFQIIVLKHNLKFIDFSAIIRKIRDFFVENLEGAENIKRKPGSPINSISEIITVNILICFFKSFWLYI